MEDRSGFRSLAECLLLPRQPSIGKRIDPGKVEPMSSNAASEDTSTGLSSAKREDFWALIIAGIVMLVSMAAPEIVHEIFEKLLYVF
jgi:hypothetical protein